jgi:replicative DNA helicase
MGVPPTQGRLPPSDVGLEESMLGACVLQPGVMAEVSGLIRPEHFYDHGHRIIYRAILDLLEAGSPFDSVLDVRTRLVEKNELEKVGGALKLHKIMDESPAISMARLKKSAKRLVDLWKVRQMISVCQEIAAIGYGTTENVDEYLQDADQRIFKITSMESRQDSMCTLKEAMYELFAEVQSRVQQKSEGKLAKPKTGLAEVDAILGGIDFGELFILAARPSMGKSSLAYCIAANCASMETVPQLGVLIISAETTHAKVASSILASQARFDLSKFQTLEFSQNDWQVLAKGVNDFSGLPILIDDSTAPSIAHIRSAIRKAATSMLVKNHDGDVTRKLGLVVVDYIQLCESESSTHGESREQVVARVARGLHSTAKDFSVGMLALSQLHRGVESRTNRRPLMSDIRNSGEIEQAGDKIVALYRDEYYDKESKDAGLAELIILKSKLTPTGVVKLRFTGKYVRFDDYEEQEYGDDSIFGAQSPQ